MAGADDRHGQQGQCPVVRYLSITSAWGDWLDRLSEVADAIGGYEHNGGSTRLVVFDAIESRGAPVGD